MLIKIAKDKSQKSQDLLVCHTTASGCYGNFIIGAWYTSSQKKTKSSYSSI